MNKESLAGKIWLVGAGPGDPELLTIKAHRVIQNADLILFDQLVSKEIKDLFPKHVPSFYVGKKKGSHSLSQSDLNRLLLTKAKQGLNVVRVKGGDPFVFGRGGEEALEAVKAGVNVEVVPGITAASGCTNGANIPLTHRGLSQACTFITAHAETSLNGEWRALASLQHTLVVYMGVSRASEIVDNLQRNGMASDMPVAIIEKGCTPQQREVLGQLGELEKLIAQENIASPAIIVIGKVVDYKHEFDSLVQQNVLAGRNINLNSALHTPASASHCA